MYDDIPLWDRPWVNVANAAKMLDTSQLFVRSLIRTGKLNVQHMGVQGRVIRILVSELRAYSGVLRVGWYLARVRSGVMKPVTAPILLAPP